MDIFVARQPIFTADTALYGYELLYRSNSAVNAAQGGSAESMASSVIIHSFVDIGMERITGGHVGFLNCSRETLVGGVVELLSPEGMVVELLETIEPDDEVVAACERLKGAGYTLALDDFEYHPRYDPLIRLSSIVKLDVLNRTPDQIAALVEPLRPFGVRLLAERVENAEIHAACEALGCELFQGYYYSRPEILTKREVSTEQIAVLRAMNLLRDDNTPDARIEEVFRTNITLSYKLLRIVNSAALGGRGVDSILQAIRMLGRAALQRWLGLMLIAMHGRESGLNREIALNAITRARLCESVAQAAGKRALAAPLFMVGLLSLLDRLTGQPMEEVLQGIDLTDEVRDALLERTGAYAVPLRLVEAYGEGEWDDAAREAEHFGVAAGDLAGLYLDAVTWAQDRFAEATTA